ncbi:MAG: DUF2937 family protein [Rhodospirillales bacterium]|nr:DUF2937 family protein [Rhodospirillales bacterium]
MGWLLRKVDMLGGAVIAGSAGAGASQLQAFMVQYLQRLGGHVDEAQRAFDALGHGQRYRQMDGPTREMIAEDAMARVNELRTAHDAILQGDLISRPFAFFRHLDIDIAGRTWDGFSPALPFDTAGLAYAAAGLILGLVLYELIKAAFALPFQRRPAATTAEPPRPR